MGDENDKLANIVELLHEVNTYLARIDEDLKKLLDKQAEISQSILFVGKQVYDVALSITARPRS